MITAAVKANRAESVLPGDIDTIVVPGAGMNGTTPSLLFALRLRRAYALMESAPNSRVVVCGGQGDNEAITEADCGKAYLIALGADPERIFTEVQSRDTYENLKYFCALFPAETKIALVSNDFHIYRCNLLAKRNGLEAVLYSAPTPYLYLKLNYFPREYISLVIARIEALGITIDTSNFHLAYSANSAVY